MKLGVHKMACSSLYSILVSENQQENGHRLKVYWCMHLGRQSLKISYSITYSPVRRRFEKGSHSLWLWAVNSQKSNEWNFILT